MARAKADPAGFPHVFAEHSSPLRRDSSYDERLQRGKERNVARAAQLLDRIAIPPGTVFSYHHAVGRPSRFRGFTLGLELHGGEPGKGIGGGCCQVSNLLYLIALRAGLDIVERHRHALDLFPDHGRTVPFGCGATVFYNSADLRLQNPYSFPVMLSFGVTARHLHGRVLSTQPLPHAVEIYEVDHRFEKLEEGWYRENHIRRRFVDSGGNVLRDEEVAHNRGRCLYEPET